MRVVESAIWTSGDPVSFSARLYSAINLPLTSVSAAKLVGKYTGTRLATVRCLSQRGISHRLMVASRGQRNTRVDSTRLAPNTPLKASILHVWHQRCI